MNNEEIDKQSAAALTAVERIATALEGIEKHLQVLTLVVNQPRHYGVASVRVSESGDE